MKGKCSFKKLAALVLSGAMALGALPMPGLVHEAHAETDTSTLSSVAYATKEQLGKVTPPVVAKETGYTGDVTKVGRIKLGRDEKGNAMEWYLLGSDSGVSGSNVAIFAASDMTTSAFNTPDFYTKGYNSSNDGTYEETVESGYNIWSNHYGASTLRKNLQSYVDGSDYKYFSSAEQGIMQATKVDTPDYKNNDGEGDDRLAVNPKIYTTSDKLYLAWGDPRYYDTCPSGDKYAKGNCNYAIYVGNGNGRSQSGKAVLLYNSDLKKSSNFWLRTPYSGNLTTCAMYVRLGSSLEECEMRVEAVTSTRAVRPASNLNLSSVSFASAASAATSDTAVAKKISTSAPSHDAMMLRLNPGSMLKIGTATYDAEKKYVTAKKDPEAGTDTAVTLIVQGRYIPDSSNTDTDWYYTKRITSTEGETIKVDDIAAALVANGVKLSGTTAEDTAACIDLSKCAIWLETPVMEQRSGSTASVASQTLFYAVQAVDGAHTCVEKENAWGSDGESHWHICETCGQQMGDKIKHIEPDDEAEGAWQKSDTQHWKNCTECRIEISATKKDHTSEWYSGDENDHWQICKVCGKELSSAEKHSFTWKADKADPEKHNGTCSCGRVVEEEHTYDEHKSDATDHWYVCSKCGAEKPDSREAHKFENGKCNVEGCGYDGKHDITKREDKEEPTCTEDGYEAYWKCSQKGHEDEVFLESGTGIYVLADAPTPIPALGHKPGDEYKTIDGTYCAPVCDRENGDDICGVVITDEKEKHDPDDDGICTKCGYDRYEDEHRHIYDDTVWEDNASYHWHQCTDAECPDVKDSIKDKARHIFESGKCDVCGRTRAYDDSFDDDDSSDTEYTAVDADGSWDQGERGWRFRYTNGTYAKGSVVTAADGTAELHVGWARVGGSWFAFDADGYMMQDWIYDAASGSWYYSDLTGMKTGWMQSPQDGRWYYLDPNSGAMHINTTTPDGSRVGADGAKVSTFGT